MAGHLCAAGVLSLSLRAPCVPGPRWCLLPACPSARAEAPAVAFPRPHAANFVPGCYALRVKGTLSNQHVVTLENNGIRYRPLDDEQTAHNS